MNIFVISCMYSLYLTITNAMHLEHILGDTVTKKIHLELISREIEIENHIKSSETFIDSMGDIYLIFLCNIFLLLY